MRAALLPAGPDPFLLAFWLRGYAKLWANEVEELRIIVCGQSDPAILAYLRDLVASVPHATMTSLPQRTDHGHVLGQLVASTDADLVTFCEDDAYVRQPGVVDAAFGRIERGETDIVGCPRGSASEEIIIAAHDRFGDLPETANGETGHSLWPCFLFAKRADLLATDGHFGARSWVPGDEVKGLGLVATKDLSSDTMGSATYQLRDLGKRIAWIANYRVDAANLLRWHDAPWFHIGSLSTGYGSTFLAGLPETEYRRRVDAMRDQKWEWCKRASWWRRAWRAWDGGLPEFHAAYGEALERFIADAGLDQIGWWDDAFAPMVTWQ